MNNRAAWLLVNTVNWCIICKTGSKVSNKKPGLWVKQNDKPFGHFVLFHASCLFHFLCVTHELNAHFPSLPLFFSCSYFSHINLLVSVWIQLVFLSLKYNKYNKYIVNCHSPETWTSMFNAQVLQLANEKKHELFFFTLALKKNHSIAKYTSLWPYL